MPATPAGRDRLAKKYEIAGKLLAGSIQTWFAFPHFFQYQEPVNTLTAAEVRRPAGWSRSAPRSATTSWPTTRRWS